MDINVTKHARERWEERVNPTADANAEEQVKEAFSNAEYIWTDASGKSFYINSDRWVFCTEVSGHNVTIITVYPADINSVGRNKRTLFVD